jgi:putative ABC transport system permease protein
MRLLIRKFKLQISYFKIKILLPKQTCNKIVFSCQTTMMLNLFKENVRIAGRFHKNPNTYFTHRIDYRNRITALVGILTVVSAENTISSDFASMGSNTFNVKQYENTTQRQEEERKIINPLFPTLKR